MMTRMHDIDRELAHACTRAARVKVCTRARVREKSIPADPDRYPRIDIDQDSDRDIYRDSRSIPQSRARVRSRRARLIDRARASSS